MTPSRSKGRIGMIVPLVVAAAVADARAQDWTPETFLPLRDTVEGIWKYPVASEPGPRRSFWEKWRAWNSGSEERIPGSFLPFVRVDTAKAFPRHDGGLHLTWIGHSSVALQIEGVRVLIDPVFTTEVSPVPWIRSVRRFQEESPLRAQDLSSIDVVLLTHDHYDHMDKDALLALAPRTSKFLAPLGVGARLVGWGVPAGKVRELTWWQEDSMRTPAGTVLRLACVPARHFSGRTLTDRNTTLWAGWAIVGGRHRIYHSGDTGYGPHFALIGRRHGPFDVAMVESAQYNDLWPQSHMTPEQAVQAHLDVGARWFMPIHWGAFSLSSHAWNEPAERADSTARSRGVAMLTPRVGETLSISETTATSRWWRNVGTEIVQGGASR